MSIMYTYNDEMNKEKMTFLRLLYHDRRGGQMIRLCKHGDVISQYSTCDEVQLADTGTDGAHYYTSVNTFRGRKRTADKLYCYCSIYIDLDCHAPDPEMIANAKARTVKLLEEAYASGEIAIPTMITDTGRGYGLQYVLARSIANTDNNVAQQDFFRYVRKLIHGKYRVLMEQDAHAATVDPAVLDDARVCRMPGTYNADAGEYCRLISVTERCYDLSELVQECHLWEWDENKKEKKQSKKLNKASQDREPSYVIQFLKNRILQLKKLIEMRGKACTDNCREQILFVAYSALKQVNHDTAIDELQNLNNTFPDPLDWCELEHIITETDANVGSNYRGYYKLPNDYLIRNLNLSEEEIQALNIGNWKRLETKRETAKKREKKRQEIICLLMQEDRLTYNEIADAAGVSRRTVCTIAREEGLGRYKNHKVRLENMEVATTTVASSVGESAKKYIGSVCVDVLGDSSVLSLQFQRLWAECASLSFASFELLPELRSFSPVVLADALRDLAVWYVNTTYNYVSSFEFSVLGDIFVPTG